MGHGDVNAEAFAGTQGRRLSLSASEFGLGPRPRLARLLLTDAGSYRSTDPLISRKHIPLLATNFNHSESAVVVK
jgi:hypothetical protein